ncbi:UDP-glucuronosyl/UDP-glucosyltransferase [Corchorus capsularis]|uniref:UDP-glucuronosyl/UDP-glucosyltransferase n=1 Tax=Corchorus capsularis TaxID=210143 RepID=A0A1R3I977_COCAP|nr:UDP-glucuronosyl/UDP-glucosyltransferase [Corchorus capsularis]
MASSIAQKPHAICIPSPGQGHINPMMNLAKIFHHKGFYVTFVNTECNNKRLLSSMGPSSLDGFPDFRFETIPDGVPLDITQDITSLLDTLTENVVDPLRRLIHKFNDFESSIPPVTCIVAYAAVPFLEAITEEFGILGVRLGTAGASTFERYTRVRLLVEQGLIPVTTLFKVKQLVLHLDSVNSQPKFRGSSAHGRCDDDDGGNEGRTTTTDTQGGDGQSGAEDASRKGRRAMRELTDEFNSMSLTTASSSFGYGGHFESNSSYGTRSGANEFESSVSSNMYPEYPLEQQTYNEHPVQ